MTPEPGAARRWRHPAVQVMVASVLAQAALVVSGPIAFRLLGAHGRGQLALAWAIAVLVSQVALLGIPAAMTRYMAGGRVTVARVWAPIRRPVIGQLVAGGLVAAVLVLLCGDLIATGADAGWAAAAVACGTVGIMIAVLGSAAMSGQGRFSAVAALTPVPALSYAVALLALVLIAGESTVLVVLAILMAGWVLVAGLALGVVGRAGRAPAGDPAATAPTRGELTAYGRSAAVAGAAPIDALGIEQLLVGALLGSQALGLFTVGWAFETAPVLVLVALAGYVGPRVAALAGVEQSRFVRRWALAALGLGVVVCVAVQAVLEPVLRLAFGAAALPALPLARVLVVAGVLLGARRVLASALVGLGRARAATWCEAAGLLTLVAGLVATAVTDAGLTVVGWVLLAAGVVAVGGQCLALMRAPWTSAPGSAGLSAPT